uniref:Uncharacterized protein n=1 Tax=Anguilla anguilla TaxID=7936 RepID=A0A0E9THI4_ANGAN
MSLNPDYIFKYQLSKS